MLKTAHRTKNAFNEVKWDYALIELQTSASAQLSSVSLELRLLVLCPDFHICLVIALMAASVIAIITVLTVVGCPHPAQQGTLRIWDHEKV
jgi:hypothetical protein